MLGDVYLYFKIKLDLDIKIMFCHKIACLIAPTWHETNLIFSHHKVEYKQMSIKCACLFVGEVILKFGLLPGSLCAYFPHLIPPPLDENEKVRVASS